MGTKIVNKIFVNKLAFPKKCGFAHFLALFLESVESPLSVQINVFAVRL